MTHAVGITIRTTSSCPHVRGAVVDIATGSLIRTFNHRASAGESADQLHELGQDFASELAAQDVVAVVIREVGFARQAGFTAPVKNRLRAEGSCVAVARKVTAKVAVLDINAIGHLLGVDDPEDSGRAIASGDYVEPATAALAAANL